MKFNDAKNSCTKEKALIKSGQLSHCLTAGIDANVINSMTTDTLDCSSCVIGKMTRQSFRNQGTSILRSSRPLGLIHADLIGPISIKRNSTF